MLLNDKQITKLAVENDMIVPFEPEQVRFRNASASDDPYGTDPIKTISKGISSFGYDVSLGNSFLAYTNPNSVHQSIDKWDLVVDPLDFDMDLLEGFDVDPEIGYVIIPPHGYFLSHSVETIKMPSDVNAICLTKSTYARVGIFLNTTPLEAGWEGVITLEIANLSPRPVKLYPNQGICQVQFFQGERPAVTYADRSGKYQHQTGITLPKG